jgi:CHRD domain-containing protein
MSLNTKRSARFPISRYGPLISLAILAISLISMPAFAQQANFVASLSGQNLSPKVSTAATGTAKFNVGPDGNMIYIVDGKNIKGIIGAHISLKNGTDVAQVFNPYVEINGKSGIPTGQVNGQISKGVITANDLSGPLSGKTINDLASLMKNDSVNVVIRTQSHENGEIQGAITPSTTTQKQPI